MKKGWKKCKNLESQSVLVGPFPEHTRKKSFGSTAAIYSNNKVVNYLPIEGNSGFVIYQNTLVNKSDRFEKWFNKKMANYSVLSLYDKPLSRADIDYIYKSDFQKVVCQTYSEQPIYSTLNNDYKEKGKLTLTLLNDEQEKQLEQMLILFSPIGNGDSLAIERRRLYYDESSNF